MATFRNRDGKWQARVRRQGYAAITKSFIALKIRLLPVGIKASKA